MNTPADLVEASLASSTVVGPIALVFSLCLFVGLCAKWAKRVVSQL